MRLLPHSRGCVGVLVLSVLVVAGCSRASKSVSCGEVEGLYSQVRTNLDTLNVYQNRSAVAKAFTVEPVRQALPDLDAWTVKERCSYAYRTEPLDKAANAPENALKPKIHGFLEVFHDCDDPAAKAEAEQKAHQWSSELAGWPSADAAKADCMRESSSLAANLTTNMAVAGMFNLDFDPLKCASERAAIQGESHLFDLQLACRKFGEPYTSDFLTYQRAGITKALGLATKELARKRVAAPSPEALQRCGGQVAEKIEALPTAVEFQAGSPNPVLYPLGLLKGETVVVSAEAIAGGPTPSLTVLSAGCEDVIQKGWGRIVVRVAEDGTYPLIVGVPGATGADVRYKVEVETDGKGQMSADRRKEVTEFTAWAQRVLGDDVTMSDFLRFREGSHLACARSRLLQDASSLRHVFFKSALEDCSKTLDVLVNKHMAAANPITRN